MLYLYLFLVSIARFFPQIKAVPVFIASHSHTYVMWSTIYERIWGRSWGFGISTNSIGLYLANGLKSSRCVQISLCLFSGTGKVYKAHPFLARWGVSNILNISIRNCFERVKFSHISSSSLYPPQCAGISQVCWRRWSPAASFIQHLHFQLVMSSSGRVIPSTGTLKTVRTTHIDCWWSC